MDAKEEYLRAQTQAILEATTDGIVVVDTDGRIKAFSRRFQEILGMPGPILESGDANQVVAFMMGMVTAPDIFLEKWNSTAADSEDTSIDVLLLKDGRILEVHSRPQRLNGQVIGRIWVLRDVTARDRAQEAPWEGLGLLGTVINGVSILIAYIDQDGRYRFANQAYADWYGLTPGELLGKRVAEVLSPELYQKVVAHIDEALAGQPVSFNSEVVGPDGGQRYFIANYDPHFEGDAVIGIFATIYDITERARAEMAMRQTKEKLKFLDELEAKHKKLEELNTALNYLLEKRKSDEINIKEQIAANMRHLVYPFLEKIESRPLDPQLKALVNAVRFNLEQITDQFSKTFSSVRYGLTPTEIRVADLIRQGEKSKDIAKILGVSFKTVESHRERIRKKFGLAHQKKNLRSFLLSIE